MIKGVIFLMVSLLAAGCGSGELKITKKKEKASAQASQGQQPEAAAQQESAPEGAYLQQLKLRYNPFLTKEEQERFAKGGREIIAYLDLSAVFYAPGYSYAVVDGRIIKEKDKIGDKQVVAIEPENIILRDNRGEYIVNLRK